MVFRRLGPMDKLPYFIICEYELLLFLFLVSIFLMVPHPWLNCTFLFDLPPGDLETIGFLLCEPRQRSLSMLQQLYQQAKMDAHCPDLSCITSWRRKNARGQSAWEDLLWRIEDAWQKIASAWPVATTGRQSAQ